MKSKNHLKGNIWRLNASAFLKELMFFLPIYVPFLKDLGLSMQEILLTEAAFAVTMVVMELPSGYFADRFGRKTALIMAAVFNVFGFGMLAVAGNFELLIVAQVLIGLGWSFNSGADSALLYETLEQNGGLKKYKKEEGNLFFASRVAAVIAQGLGGVLFLVEARAPFYFSIMPFVIILILSFGYRETRVHHEIFGTLKHFWDIVADSFGRNKKLRSFLFFGAATGLFSIGYFLNQAYMELVELPLAYFGVVAAALNIAAGVGAKYAHKIEEHLGSFKALGMVILLPLVAWLGIFAFTGLWVLVLMPVVAFVWGYTMPVFKDFVQKLAKPDRRATVMSILSMLRKVMYSVFAPMVGYVADVLTAQEAFLATAVIYLIIGGLGLIGLRKVKVV